MSKIVKKTGYLFKKHLTHRPLGKGQPLASSSQGAEYLKLNYALLQSISPPLGGRGAENRGRAVTM